MKAPPPLRPGDRIGIVSTARKVTAHELLPLVNLIKSWGLTAVLGKTIGAAHGICRQRCATNGRPAAHDGQPEHTCHLVRAGRLWDDPHNRCPTF
ncbi:MAG: hypothetical protein ACPGQR_03190 [Marinirhabdus sp.]